MIAEEVFEKAFSDDMIITRRDYYAEVTAWLENYVNKQLDEPSFKAFGKELTEKIQLIENAHKERTDRELGIRALNNRLESNNLPYVINQDKDTAVYTLETIERA